MERLQEHRTYRIGLATIYQSQFIGVYYIMNMCFLSRIIMALAFTHIACNTVFAEACDVPPAPASFVEGASPVFILPNFRTWQQPPWDIGATSEDSVFAEFSPEGTLIIRGKGKMVDFEIDRPWKIICEEKNKLSKVFIENGVTHIGYEAFMFCNDLTIAIPSSVTSIGAQVFSFSNLSSITIPNSVISIEERAFSYSNLSSVTIPNSVTSIGEMAFLYNENLKTISVDAYRQAGEWKDFKNIEPIE